MRPIRTNLRIFLVISFLLFASSLAIVVNANHAWGKYHWDKSTADTLASPLVLGDNLTTAAWKDSLSGNVNLGISGASFDWNLSVLKNTVVIGNNTSCNPTSGQVEICNGEYGTNGWLGIASIWATRGKNNHITQGVVKVNDTYYNTAQYDTPAWRDLVMCQEVGHTFGLDHQDENHSNANLGTCMDYTNDPESNRHPNQHDYDMLTEIYAHLNSTDGGGGGGNGRGGGKGKPADAGVPINLNNPSEWGQAIKQDAQGRNSLFKRNLPNGQVLVTHVTWAN
jgi:hypothetical protein